MANQLLLNPFPSGLGWTPATRYSMAPSQLAGSAVTTGEPINWGDIISGVGYNEINWRPNIDYGTNGNGTAAGHWHWQPPPA